MTDYVVPPPPADRKPRMVKVTDPVEIEAITRADFHAPIGMRIASDGTVYAEEHSLRQFRGLPVEIVP